MAAKMSIWDLREIRHLDDTCRGRFEAEYAPERYGWNSPVGSTIGEEKRFDDSVAHEQGNMPGDDENAAS